MRKTRRKKLEEKEGESDSLSSSSSSSHHHTSSPASSKHGSAGSSSGSSSSVGKAKSKGDIWTHDSSTILTKGLQVAALVDADSSPRLWILATVREFHSTPRPRYEVIDADPGEEGNPMPKKRYMLPAKKVLPLPDLQQVPMSKRREFSKNQAVLALFPVGGITTFYPAVVIKSPKQTKSDSYLLEFDDDDGEQREVNAQFVAPLLEEDFAE